VGVATGVTTVIDAGSTGADDVDDFYQLTRKAATEFTPCLTSPASG
jgi:dihydroorotase